MEKTRGLKRRPKDYSKGEEIGNSITHGLGVALGIVALIIMVVKSNTGLEIFASLMFSISIIILYLMSTLYHAISNKTAKAFFKKMDHASIYILIAGSYAPFLLLILGGVWGIVIFCVQWALVLIGITFKSIWIKRFSKVHMFFFLLMGWMCIAFIGDVIAHSSGTFGLLLAGGICYTVGAMLYASRLFKYHHMVWHILVFAGTLCHFLSVAIYIL